MLLLQNTILIHNVCVTFLIEASSVRMHETDADGETRQETKAMQLSLSCAPKHKE